MYPHRRIRLASLRIFLIMWPFCSGTIVTGQSPEIRPPAPIPTPYYANPQVNVPSIRKFTFKHAKAADVLKILQQLAGQTDHIGLKIAVDERTNSLVFQPDDDRQTREFEETCALLDTETPSSSVSTNGVSIAVPALGPKPLTFDFSIGIASDNSIETLKKRYNELEQQTHQLADKLKQSTALSESDRRELQAAVRQSFEARQAMQRAELADLAQRMKSMQQSIDMRDKLADKVVQRRVEDLLNPDLKWDMTRTSTESTRSIAKEDSIGPSKITSSQDMQTALQGTWTVRVFQTEYQGDDRVSQVVIRGDLLLLHTIVNGKVLGVSPWKLVWPNAEKPYEIGAIWDPNTNTESEPFMPGRIAYDGKSFQLAFGEENPTAICPGEKTTYIDCVRANNEDRSTAAQAITPTSSQSTERAEPDASRQPISRAIREIINQLTLGDDSKPPIGIVLTEIDSNPKEQLADFKEEIQEQVVSELKTFGHLIVASRRVAEATLSSLQLKTKDLLLPKFQAQFFEALEKEDQAPQSILLTKLIRDDSTSYLLTFELIDRSGRVYKSSAKVSKTNPENSNALAKSSFLPPSIPPTPISAPYDSGRRPETIIMERIQGKWIAESLLSAGKDSLSDYSEPFGVWITGNEMRFKVGEQDLNGPIPILLTGPKGSHRSLESADQPLPMDFVMDPNGEQVAMHGIIASDGLTLSICFADGDESKKNGFRPTSFVPGSKVTVIKCRRAPTSTANKPGAADLATPQATLDYLHRYSLAHPDGFPAECYTDEAILELSGMMLQNLSAMSAISQIALQTGGVIGENNGVPVVSSASPAFHIQVEAMLKEQMLPTPPESANKAFETLATLTFGSKSSNAASLVLADRQLIRLAAGVLKSPREFLPAASKLLETLGETDLDVTKSKEADRTQPKADIAINGDEATATLLSSGNDSSLSPLSAPRITKLRRIDGRWLISEILSDEEIAQMQSSYSSVMDPFGGAEEVKSDKSKTSKSATQKIPISSVESSKTDPPEWSDFLKVLPETGTALVMFSYEPEIKEQMLPVAKKVAEAASAQLIELPQTTWRKIIAPPATHFVLMKDRQLVGTRTGLMTEARLQDFVAKAKDWLTPQSTGIDENSLVRIDCFINPGTDNIGSQHGEAFPFTTAVVAIHGYQTLLLGPEGIAEYIEKGYACVAIVRDEYGQQKQLPLDVVLKGPVKLAARGSVSKMSAATASISFGDGDSKEIALPFLDGIYPKSFTETLEAYDVGSAIYRISGAHGLTPVKLAAVNDPPKVDQRVLSGSFTGTHQSPPLHGFRSPIHWQSQTVPKVGGHIYGGNINGAEMLEVLCPTRPAPCGFTFNEHGRLVGMYGLGEPSEKDMTHTVFMPDTTHSILFAALEKIDAPGLKAALAQTLEESKTAASNKDENRPAAVNAANANTSPQPLTNSPAKFDTPQALLARVDESSKAGSYEEFLALFSDEGVRDLAGSMLMSAVMQSSMDELARQQTAGGLKEIDSGTLAIRKVLQRWLPQSATTAQQEALGKGLSTMMSAIGGASPDQAALKEFVISMRESVMGISDHREFCIEIMQAFEKLTSSKFIYFGNADHESEWQISQFGDRAIATLIDGSPGMATTITLQQSSDTWRISSLFNELVIEAKPATTLPSSTAPSPSPAKTVTRRYSVGSFVTESFFTGKGSFDLKKEYDKYETEIEQSLQDLAKTVTAACTQPPKFVQVVSSTRSLLIGHHEAGHAEIAEFMRDIGINNEQIRLKGAFIEITQDEAKSLGIDLAQHVLSVEESKKLNDFAIGDVAKRRKSENKAKRGYSYIDFVAMNESIYSGTRMPIKHVGAPISLTIAARISPATRQIQIRLDMPFGDENEHGFASQFQILTDGQSVLFEIFDNSYWLVTADIVPESAGSLSGPAIENGTHTTSTSEPKYSGHSLSWWLDSYWDNAMASPKTAENIAQEYVASEAIRKLREKPECKAVMETALAKWFASVEHEVNEVQITRAAKCFVTAAGPEYQETAVNFLFKIWKRMPLLTHEQLVEAADDASELNQLLSQLMLNDQLAIQFADRLTNGNSAERSLVVYGLLSLMGRFGIETNKDLTELENWLRKHAERLAPAIEAASKDENEHIRFTALIQLATLIHATKLDPESLRLPTILLTAASDASPNVRCIAIDLLTSDEFAPAIKSQNAQIASMLISAMESDSSINVRYSALNALMHMNVEAELVHKSLMEWAKSDEHEKVKYALDLTLRNYQAGDRPQSIDELVELLSDPEWGTKVEVNYNNWSTHHRWARQYAIAILGEYSAHAYRAIPTLESELARNNKDTLSFATQALDRVRGYCPDLPIDKLQGEWVFVSIEKTEGSAPFFDFQASSDQQPASVITISGTQLKLGDRVLAELSHYRSGSRQGMQLLLDADGKKLHCNGWHSFNPEFQLSSGSRPEWVKLEVRELLNDSNATEKSKQVYEFRPLKSEAR